MPPPIPRVPCPPLNQTHDGFNTTGTPHDLNNEDLNALLYIVVTLLFYSLGIVVGIITYLKREKREMEEDKTFDMFMSMKHNENFNVSKQQKVLLVTARLEEIERRRLLAQEREKRERHRLSSQGELEAVSVDVKGEQSLGSQRELEPDSVDVKGEGGREEGKTEETNSCSSIPQQETSNTTNSSSKRLHLTKQTNVFQVSPSGEPISAVVAKIFDTERRGGLPNSPKALHLFQKNERGRLSRDQDSLDRELDTSSSSLDTTARLAEPDGCLVTHV